MFTVLSNTRNSNLFLIGALAIVVITLLTLAIVPAVSAPQPAAAPASRLSEAGSDYYQRHPELSVSTALESDMGGDFYLRHPEWASNVQNAAILVTGNSEASDYFQRHPELSAVGVATPLAESLETPGMACESPVDCR
ncbi:MAG TPA: hypothetical protein VGK56_17425 [Anaerolineales bacterium]